MGNVSVSCLLLLTFHLLTDLKSKLRSPVGIFSSSSCKTSKEKQLQLNNQEPSYSFLVILSCEERTDSLGMKQGKQLAVLK